MRTKVVLILCLLSVLAGCKKDSVNDDNDDDKKNNNKSYTQVNGSWEWVGKTWLHIPSDHGIVHNAWVVNGDLYCHWTEDIGAQLLGKISYYNGTGWDELYNDVNANAFTSFAVHDGKLLLNINDYNEAYTIAFSGGTSTYLDTADYNYNTYNAYLAATGTDLYRILVPYYTNTSSVQVSKFTGNDWVVTDSAASVASMNIVNSITLSGDDEIYVILYQAGTLDYYIYTYSGPGTWASFGRKTYASGETPGKFFVHDGELHVMEAAPGQTDGAYRIISKLESGGASSTVISLPDSLGVMLEAFSTEQGILYTTGTINLAYLNVLKDVWRKGPNKTYRYNAAPDSASSAAATPTSLLGTMGYYFGSVFFFYNGNLYAISNAHAGVFGGTGQPATKVFLARYNVE